MRREAIVEEDTSSRREHVLKARKINECSSQEAGPWNWCRGGGQKGVVVVDYVHQW